MSDWIEIPTIRASTGCGNGMAREPKAFAPQRHGISAISIRNRYLVGRSVYC